MVFVSAMVVLEVVSAVGVLADPRVLTGAPIWLKPFKFPVSFVLYGATLAWMLSLLPRRSRVAAWAGTVIVAMSLVETVVPMVLPGQDQGIKGSAERTVWAYRTAGRGCRWSAGAPPAEICGSGTSWDCTRCRRCRSWRSC